MDLARKLKGHEQVLNYQQVTFGFVGSSHRSKLRIHATSPAMQMEPSDMPRMHDTRREIETQAHAPDGPSLASESLLEVDTDPAQWNDLVLKPWHHWDQCSNWLEALTCWQQFFCCHHSCPSSHWVRACVHLQVTASAGAALGAFAALFSPPTDFRLAGRIRITGIGTLFHQKKSLLRRQSAVA